MKLKNVVDAARVGRAAAVEVAGKPGGKTPLRMTFEVDTGRTIERKELRLDQVKRFSTKAVTYPPDPLVPSGPYVARGTRYVLDMKNGDRHETGVILLTDRRYGLPSPKDANGLTGAQVQKRLLAQGPARDETGWQPSAGKPTTKPQAVKPPKPGAVKVPPLTITFEVDSPTQLQRFNVKLSDVERFDTRGVTYPPQPLVPSSPLVSRGTHYLLTLKDGRRLETGVILAFDPKDPSVLDRFSIPDAKDVAGKSGAEVQRAIAKAMSGS